MNQIQILEKLISYKSISETSNIEIAEFIIDFLKKIGFKSNKIEGHKGRFNVYSCIGPDKDGGIILSGHTDVVPTTGQSWLTDPFKLHQKGRRLYGRGSADMKGFISVVLSLMKKVKTNKLKKPIHLIFSYDEEVGCIGIQKLLPFLKKLKPRPKYCIVGEPTEMKLVTQHKGKKKFDVIFHGVEAHSSLIEDGVNSISYCANFLNFLAKKEKSLRKNKNLDFSPCYSTINVGTINGGIAVNIIPKICSIEFEIRDIPNSKTTELIEEIQSYLINLEKEMKIENKRCKIEFLEKNDFPPLYTEPQSEIVSKCLRVLKSNSIDTVSFGTEAGLFNKLNLQTIVCGPGSIKQAHKPNEFIELSQLKKCEKFLIKIIDTLY